MAVESYALHGDFDEVPAELIIHLTHIKLKGSKISFPLYSLSSGVNNLTPKNDIIRYGFAFNEGILVRRDQFSHNGLEPTENCFGDDFICNITQADGSKVTNFCWSDIFDNKCYQGFVKLFKHVS